MINSLEFMIYLFYLFYKISKLDKNNLKLFIFFNNSDIS